MGKLYSRYETRAVNMKIEGAGALNALCRRASCLPPMSPTWQVHCEGHHANSNSQKKYFGQDKVQVFSFVTVTWSRTLGNPEDSSIIWACSVVWKMLSTCKIVLFMLIVSIWSPSQMLFAVMAVEYFSPVAWEMSQLGLILVLAKMITDTCSDSTDHCEYGFKFAWNEPVHQACRLLNKILLRWLALWLLRWLDWEKVFPHVRQEYGLSPVWILVCICKLPFALKALPQMLHWNGFSPVWVLMWIS
jgi:hypothetical protein